MPRWSLDEIQSQFIDCVDFPIPGFVFPDITPMVERRPDIYRAVIDAFCNEYRDKPIDAIVCIESFGYVFGMPVAYNLGTRIAIARREGKLPRNVVSQEYSMIYDNSRRIEMNHDSLKPGDNVLIIDDFLASGGTLGATVSLIESLGANAVGISCVVEILGVGGRERINRDNISYQTLIDMSFQNNEWIVSEVRF